MTELSFGQVFNTSAIDHNSVVNMSHCPEAVSYLEQTIGNPIPQDPNHLWGDNPVAFFGDDFGDREFAYINGNGFKVYAVNTSGSSISLLSTTSIVVPDDLIFWLGIKRVNGSLYNAYYVASNDMYSPTYVNFGKLSIVPGVSCTNSIIQNNVLDTTGSSRVYTIRSVKVIGRTGYVALSKAYLPVPDPNVWAYMEYFIYSLNMDSEVSSGGSQYRTPDGYAQSMYYSASERAQIQLIESGGTVHWISFFRWSPTGGGSYTVYIIIDGTPTPISVGFCDTGGGINTNQYNSNDYLCTIYFRMYTNLTVLYTAQIANGVITISSGALSYPQAGVVTFHSGSQAVVYYSGVYYWVDKTTGAIISAVSISGVDSIYDIFPTLDSMSGSAYMNVSIGGVKKIISTNGTAIDKIYDVILPVTNTAPNDFNHGNFFVQWVISGSMYVTYLINLIAPQANVVQMIID